MRGATKIGEKTPEKLSEGLLARVGRHLNSLTKATLPLSSLTAGTVKAWGG